MKMIFDPNDDSHDLPDQPQNPMSSSIVKRVDVLARRLGVEEEVMNSHLPFLLLAPVEALCKKVLDLESIVEEQARHIRSLESRSLGRPYNE